MKTNILQKNIPKGWRQEKLSVVAEVLSGATPKTSELQYWGGEIVWVTPKDLSYLQQRFLNDSERKITEVGLKSCSAVLVPENSLVMSSRAPIGYLAINKVPVATNQGCKSIVPGNSLDIEYLYYYLTNNIEDVKRLGKGSTFAEVGKSAIESVKILLPSLPEQKKIAEILGTVDEEIQKVEEVISKIEELKNGLMDDIIKDQNKTIIFSDLVDLGKEKVDPKDSKNEKYIGLEHIDQGTGRLLGWGVSGDTLSIKSVFRKGDILFGKLRPYLKKYWKADFDGVCTTEIFVFKPKNSFDLDYIFQIVQSDDFIKYSDSRSFGTKMPRTDWSIVSSYTLPDFSKEKRQKVGEVLSKIDEKWSVSYELRKKLIQLKKGLMADLLTGKVRVK